MAEPKLAWGSQNSAGAYTTTVRDGAYTCTRKRRGCSDTCTFRVDQAAVCTRLLGSQLDGPGAGVQARSRRQAREHLHPLLTSMELGRLSWSPCCVWNSTLESWGGAGEQSASQQAAAMRVMLPTRTPPGRAVQHRRCSHEARRCNR